MSAMIRWMRSSRSRVRPGSLALLSGVQRMQIDGRAIGPGFAPYIIAEVSNNHLADPERACRLIEVAAKAGADAVKIQTYDADSLTIDSDRPEFIIRTPPWEGLNY